MAGLATLKAWIREHLDDDPDDPVMSDDLLDEILRRHRVLGLHPARRALNPSDYARYGVSSPSPKYVNVNADSGMVTLPMFNSGASGYQYWDRQFVYHMHPDMLQVLVDDVAVDADSYTFYPVSCSLIFKADVASTATVHVKGFMVNMIAKGAMYEAFHTWANKFATKISVRGNEYDRAAERARRAAGQYWAGRNIWSRRG